MMFELRHLPLRCASPAVSIVTPEGGRGTESATGEERGDSPPREGIRS